VTALATDTGLRPLPTLTGTYPSPLPWPLRIPIDHALVSPELAGAVRRTGPHLGSDHRPLLIELPLPRAPA
jgi:endonuclease/exonuclease/phosphatase (EEP) superfamily protein YafD